MKPNLLGMFYKALQPEDEGGFTLRLLPLATLVENANFVEDNNLMAVAHDITQTIYDLKVVETGVQQRYLRNRVSAVYRYEDNAAMIANSGNATIYSYDELGNVNVLVQKLVVNNEVYVKQVRYEYDLQSGKVNKVTFQKGAIDQYSHRYEYDADNRITDVYTSRDGRFESRDAKYFYYPHGPLARVELGDGKVQGVDYVYTLQGWLKGTGSQDGEMGLNNFIAPGEVSYILGYYENDYQSITSLSVDMFGSLFTPYYNDASHQVNGHKGLFNGNIASMTTMIRHFGKTNFNEAYNINEYQYDQLNRIKNCDGRRNTVNLDTENTVSMSYTYDPNGNIAHLTRNGINASGTTLDMDELTYGYNSSGGKLINNRLNHVDDLQTVSSNFDNDIEDQGTGNYGYDEIGNLIRDDAKDIDEIVWDVYGKIKSINFDTKSDLDFQYDAMGNRIAKIVKNTTTQAIEKTTLYFRDAQGNVLMTEEILATVTNNIKGSREFAIYGSSRLGVYTEDVLDVLPPAAPNEYERIVGLRAYELSNHLGNVLATISDYKSIISDGTTLTYEAVVLTATDYDPFGMVMEHRNTLTKYSRGFNGAIKEDEIYGEFNAYDLGARIFDSRLARFLSTDPREREYAWQSTYAYYSNSPIATIDFMGMGEGDVFIAFGGADFFSNGAVGTAAPAIVKAVNEKIIKEQGGKASTMISPYWSVGLGNEESLDNATQVAFNYVKDNYNKVNGTEVKGGKLIIYSYSFGGVLAEHLAERLKAENINVDLLITIDAAAGPLSSLVDRTISENVILNVNYFEDPTVPNSPVLSWGEANKAENKDKTMVINNDLTGSTTHSNIDEETLDASINLVINTLDRNKPVQKDPNSATECNICD